jgi:hypothetical protein
MALVMHTSVSTMQRLTLQSACRSDCDVKVQQTTSYSLTQQLRKHRSTSIAIILET